MAMRRGTCLVRDHTLSLKWPDYVDCGNGVYRKAFYWNGRTCNRYAIEKNCSFCKKLILQDRANSKKSKNAFCSLECKGFFVTASTRGNKIIKNREHGKGSHVLIRNPDHPRASIQGLVFEHILVAETMLDRPIEKKERVHHINCVKNDNRPENLFVCENDKEHFLIHGSLNECVSDLINMGVLVFDANLKKYKVVKP